MEEGVGGPVLHPPSSPHPRPAGQALRLLCRGCYVTDTGGSQAAPHRSSVPYTIALQAVTNNLHYPSQIESSAQPSCLSPSRSCRTRGFTLCPFHCDKTELLFPPWPRNTGQSSSSDPFFEPDQLARLSKLSGEIVKTQTPVQTGAHSNRG